MTRPFLSSSGITPPPTTKTSLIPFFFNAFTTLGKRVPCAPFRDAGMEVIYSGLFATPERISQIAEDEDVDAIALSLLNGAHGTLFPRVVKALKKKGIKDVLVVGGGVIPEEDKKGLLKAGISGVFGPGTPLSSITDHITIGVSKLRKI